MILIAGLGYLGEALADHLHAAGESVVALTKNPGTAAALDAGKPYEVAPCDISRAEPVRALKARLSNLEALVHCASSGRGGADAYRAAYLEGCRNLQAILRPGRLLFTSSTSVYAQSDGCAVTEESPAEPERETGRILRETEKFLLDHHSAVARLAGIYGPGRSVILKKFLQGTAIIEKDESGRSRYLNQAHRADIVAALALLLKSDQAPGRIHNVVDDHPLTQEECYAWLARHFDRPVPPAGPPDHNRKRGWTNKEISNARLRSLGWRPRYPSFTQAVLEDPDLVASIEAQL